VRCGALRVFATIPHLLISEKRERQDLAGFVQTFEALYGYEPVDLIQERPNRCRDLEAFLFLALSWSHLNNNFDHVDLLPLFYRQHRGVRLLDQGTSVTLFKTKKESMGNSCFQLDLRGDIHRMNDCADLGAEQSGRSSQGRVKIGPAPPDPIL
jgi:hypothetical protein